MEKTHKNHHEDGDDFKYTSPDKYLALEQPGVSYTEDADIQSSKKFAGVGLQTAAGVPLQCDEGPDFRTFRIGLFGLEKWQNVERTVGQLAAALDQVGYPAREPVAA